MNEYIESNSNIFHLIWYILLKVSKNLQRAHLSLKIKFGNLLCRCCNALYFLALLIYDQCLWYYFDHSLMTISVISLSTIVTLRNFNISPLSIIDISPLCVSPLETDIHIHSS